MKSSYLAPNRNMANQMLRIFVTGGKEIQCAWTGAKDAESTVDHYLFGIGTSEGVDNIYSFTKLGPHSVGHHTKGKTQYMRASFIPTSMKPNTLSNQCA